MRNALSLLRVGVDLDGVANNLSDTIIAELKLRGWCPADFRPRDVVEYEIEKNIPGLRQEQVWEVFDRGDVFMNTEPDPDAQLTLAALASEGVQVHIVTSRNMSPWHREITEEWLRKHRFEYHRLAIYGKAEKADYAAAHKLDVFVEDYLPTAEWMADVCRLSIILDQPYNRYHYKEDDFGCYNVEPANLIRMYSWREIRKFFLRY